MKIRFQPVVPEDEDFAHDLTKSNMKDLVDKHYGGWNSEIFRGGFGSIQDFVVYSDDEKVGFVSYTVKENSLDLGNIQILPRRQSQGIGSETMRALESRAASIGCRSITLGVFPDSPAIRFYKRLGFADNGRYKMFILMKKQLAEPGTSGNVG